MKKIISILLLTLYTVATSGAIVKMHYCGEFLESWKISIQDYAAPQMDGCCESEDDDCATLEATTQCCWDDTFTLKLSNDYNANNYKVFVPDFQTFILPTPQYTSHDWVAYKFAQEKLLVTYPRAYVQGLWQNIPLYNLFQNRKIFDELNNA